MLELDHISVGYGDLPVVWDVSLRVPAKSTVALIGPKGAGKTTTLKAVMGLLPLTGGSVTFKGEPLVKVATHEIVNRGLVLAPEWRGTFSTLTVLEYLELGASTARARPTKSATMHEVFALFPRLEECQSQPAGTLSGGERQMLAMGRALMARPELLILDEPSLGLAPLIADSIFDVIGEINRQGVAILIVEQNVQLTLETAHYGYIIEGGRIVQEGLAAELLQDDRVIDAYLSL